MRSNAYLTVLMACALAACNGDETEPPEGGCEDYAGISGSASFANDVIPIFSGACSLSSSCHQSPNGMEGLSLGQDLSVTPTQMEIDAIHAAIVGGASSLSSLPIVAPGDPAGSWLMVAIEYPTDMMNECGGDCGDACPDQMPQGGGRMEQERLDIIARWIKDGAPNN